PAGRAAGGSTRARGARARGHRVRPRPSGRGGDRAAQAGGAGPGPAATRRDVRPGRRALMPLAYYSRAATEDFWSEHWAGEDVQRLGGGAAGWPPPRLPRAGP